MSILVLAVAMAGSTVAALASPGVPASTLPLESTVTGIGSAVGRDDCT